MQPARNVGSMPQPPVFRLLLAESAVLILAALVAWLLDRVAGYSILIGGSIFLAPQAWFAWRVFRHRGARAASEVVQGFYRGEATKFLLSGTGFAMVFLYVKPLNAAALFGAYIVLHIANAILLSRVTSP